MAQRINQETIFASPVTFLEGVLALDEPLAFLSSGFPQAAVRMGLVDGLNGFRKQGKNPDIDPSTDPETVWTEGGLYPYQTSEFQAVIKSSDNRDTLSGIGANKVRVIGLAGPDWEQVSEEVQLTGTGEVLTQRTDWIRLDRALVTEAGSHKINHGKIEIFAGSGGDVVSTIEPDVGQTQICVLTIPGDRRGFITGVDAGMLAAANATEAEIGLFTRDNETGQESFRLRSSFGLRGSGSSTFSDRFELPIIVKPRTDIELRVMRVDGNNTGISGVFKVVGVQERLFEEQ